MERYKVTGMSCAACQARVEKAVSGIPGISYCAVNLLTNSMTVENADPEEVIRAVRKAGYGACLICEEKSLMQQAKDLENSETPKLVKRLAASAVLTLVLMYVSMGHMMFGWPLPAALQNNFLLIGITEGVLALAVSIINRKFFINGFWGLAHGGPNMDTLVSLGSGVSFVYSVVILAVSTGQANNYSGNTEMPELYFESAAMILTLITVGKLLESVAKGRTTDAIKGLLKLAPQTATLIADGKEILVRTSEIKPGDRFIVRAGDRIPVDGFVVSGSMKIDESALTGESALADKADKARVFTATDVFEGEAVCEAVKVGSDTILSGIIETVKAASESKAPIARIADRVSSVFVPVVIGIAVVTFIVWMITGADVSEAVARAVSVLVISCPCALGLATPVAVMVGSGVGSKHGILFKTAEALEMAGRPKIVVLDKTGTITTGKAGADAVKEDSRDGVEQLKRLGLSVVMLSGDKKTRAEKIAAEVGINNVVSEILPNGKGEAVALLKEAGKVIMVGDGINDAPALKAADIGIAIGAGKDIAIDAADIVVMNSRITDVAAAIRLSRRTLLNIKENLFWAFIYNIICIPLAAGVYTGLLGWTLPPMAGALAMALSSFCVCMNALRLNLYNPYKPGKKNNKQMTSGEIDSTIRQILEKRTRGIGPVEEEYMEKTLKIEGMMCPHCSGRVQAALEQLDGVEKAEVSHESGLAQIRMTKAVDDALLVKAVEDAGYKVV